MAKKVVVVRVGTETIRIVHMDNTLYMAVFVCRLRREQ